VGSQRDTSLTEDVCPPRWIAQPERGQTLAIRTIVWIALILGRRTARVLLYPICLYFILFSVSARAASRQYLREVLQHEPRSRHLFRHYHTFASTILDRVFLLNGEFDRFDIRVHGEDVVRSASAGGEGCLLLGAHLGSFEVIRALGRRAGGARVSMVMYEENARKINSVLTAINPDAGLDVIALGKIDSMLKVQQALARGVLVGMLADRTIAGEGTLPCSFLGKPARIPLGPFRIAAMLKRPVILMFGLYRGGNRYDIHFEPLVDMRHVERNRRNAVLDAAIRVYVQRLEHYCRVAPYNWFNFYDYWN
jgi:predicted LPLAT superfamily acyltransferase